MIGPITIQTRPGSAGRRAEVYPQFTPDATPHVREKSEAGATRGLTVGHEEVGDLCEGAVSSQRGSTDPHAVVSGLHQGQFCPACFLVGWP